MVAEGTPEEVAAVAASYTGEYLGRVLRGEPLVPLTDVTFAEAAGRARGAPARARGAGNGRSGPAVARRAAAVRVREG